MRTDNLGCATSSSSQKGKRIERSGVIPSHPLDRLAAESWTDITRNHGPTCCGILDRHGADYAVDRLLATNPGLPAEKLTESSDELLELIIDDRFLSFRILSDDEGGSESGPWHSDVYGFAGVWVASSIDYSNEWFLEREDAVSVAYDRAHECVIKTLDKPQKKFQLRFDANPVRSSEIRASADALDGAATKRKTREDSALRVCGFYRTADQTYWKYNKYSSADYPASASEVLLSLVEGGPAQWRVHRERLERARDLGWIEVCSVAERTLAPLLKAIQEGAEQAEQASKRLPGELADLQRFKLAIRFEEWCKWKGHSPSTSVITNYAMAFNPNGHPAWRRGWHFQTVAELHDAFNFLNEYRASQAYSRPDLGPDEE